MTKHGPTFIVRSVVLLIAVVGVAGCSHTLTPIALDPAQVAQPVRELVYNDYSDQNVSRKYTDVRWHVAEELSDDTLLLAATASIGISHAAGQSFSGRDWTLLLCKPGGSPEIMALLNDNSGGAFTVDTVTSTDYKTLYAGGTALDNRIVKVVGVIAGDEITAEPTNGFWFMQSERGTGWTTFRALDRNGKVLYTIE